MSSEQRGKNPEGIEASHTPGIAISMQIHWDLEMPI